MVYEEIEPLSESEWQEAIASGDTKRIGRAIVSVALYHSNWREAEQRYLYRLQNPDQELRANAITCLGHIARRHRKISRHLVIPILTKLISEPSLSGRVEDALDDINRFAVNPN